MDNITNNTGGAGDTNNGNGDIPLASGTLTVHDTPNHFTLTQQPVNNVIVGPHSIVHMGSDLGSPQNPLPSLELGEGAAVFMDEGHHVYVTPTAIQWGGGANITPMDAIVVVGDALAADHHDAQ